MIGEDPDVRCEGARDELGELALGIAHGERRAALLDHVEHCGACTTALTELTQVVDALVALAPESEPPPGFEGRVLGHAAVRRQLRRPRQHRQHQLRRPPQLRRPGRAAIVGVAAGVVGIALGLGIGLGVAHGTQAPAPGTAPFGQGPRAQVASAPLRSGARTVGDVELVSGRSSWLLMSLRPGAFEGLVTCRISRANGTSQTVGRFDASAYDSAWTSPLSSAEGVVRASLVDARGRTVAVANLK